MQPALAGNTGAPYQASSIGPVRTLLANGLWFDILGDWEYDLVQIRVPLGSRRVLLIASGESLHGTPVAASQEPEAWILDPGVHTFSTNRSYDAPRYFVAMDPTDAGADAATAFVKVRAAG